MDVVDGSVLLGLVIYRCLDMDVRVIPNSSFEYHSVKVVQLS